VNCRLHSQFRHCIGLMLNTKSSLFSQSAHTSTSESISLNQLLLDEENPKTAGKQEKKPEHISTNGTKYGARHAGQWIADKAQGVGKFSREEGDAYTGDAEQHGECVAEWPDSTFLPGPFRRQ